MDIEIKLQAIEHMQVTDTLKREITGIRRMLRLAALRRNSAQFLLELATQMASRLQRQVQEKQTAAALRAASFDQAGE